MNLDQLFIPARLAELLSSAIQLKCRVNEVESESVYCIPESMLVAMFVEMGGKYEGFVTKNESVFLKMNESDPSISLSFENQAIITTLPKELIELMADREGNRIRAIMSYRGTSLKEVADRYGGKSAAANIANFLSRTDEELTHMRDSTKVKLARALDCPVEWLR